METLRTAPMLPVFTALVCGCAAFDRLGILAFIVIAPVVYAAVNFSTYEQELPNQWHAFTLGLIVCALCSWRMYHVFTLPQPSPAAITNESATVSSVRNWGKYNYATTIDLDNGQRYVTLTRFAEMMTGDRLTLSGITRNFRPGNRGFDERRFWGAKGVTSWINLDNSSVKELPPTLSIPRLRYIISRKLTIYTPKRTAAYLKAAWTGERDEQLNSQHRKWGTVHLLAISGFHVGIVILCAGLVFGDNALLLSLILWAYIFFSGAASSALRAGIMFQVGLIARSLGRTVKAVNSVCVAGVIILMYSPFMFWDIGFRLSVLCALAISTLPVRWYSGLLISPLASLVTFPQVSYTFGNIVLVGLVCNLFAPVYFTFAFTIASVLAALRLLGVPMMGEIMCIPEGIFLLWEKMADFLAESVPYTVGWNYLVAWIGTGTLIACVCRYFDIAPVRMIVITIAGSFAAFMLFV